ncbi:MAG: long-chain-fatty-acid-CoA ligase [Acidobacteria bacterium]|nr:long-chain-fatty-acid-CoA ligase [Acidobacteriota bacterium]
MPVPRTLPRLFEASADRFGANVFLLEKRTDRYQATTYADMRARVHRFAAGLMDLGLAAGDRAALVSEARNDWVLAELGIVYCGAVNVPISVKIDEPADLKFRLLHSGCRMAIVSRAHVEKIRAIKGDLPDLRLTVVLDRLDAFADDEVAAEEVAARGERALAAGRAAFDARWQSVGESDPANICYTSGTTADPKGIVLTHRNYTANIEQGVATIRPQPDWVLLNVLPWDHAFGHTCGIYMMMMSGAALASVQAGRSAMEAVKNIPLNIRETRPTIFLSVPAIAKNFRKNIEKLVREKGPRAEALLARALRNAYAYNAEGWNRGAGARAFRKPLALLYDRILFRKVRAGFGGRLQYFVGGGALLDIELQRFFYAIGIPMLQGYGLTEAAPVISANTLERHKLGSSGRLLPGVEVRICDEAGHALPPLGRGEIVVRGENVMAGYWRNEKATAEALRGGWLYTGDLGYLDEDGFLYVLGRVKSLLIADDGEKYSPEAIEEAVAGGSPYVEQLMLYNNQSPYTTALLVPSREALRGYLEGRGLSARTPEGQEAALKLLEGEIGRYRDGDRAGAFPGRWLPSAVAVLGEGFTEQNHMLNSTLKMVRGRIQRFYQARIDYLYTPEGRSILNEQNRAIISRLE